MTIGSNLIQNNLNVLLTASSTSRKNNSYLFGMKLAEVSTETCDSIHAKEI